MALGSALVDRARVVAQQPLPIKVGGSTRFAEVEGEWFRCRLTLPAAPETADASGARRRPVIVPTLLYGVRDLQGGEVALSTENRVEVRSAALGDAQWEVVSNPEPLRKKRTIIGYQVTLRKVLDQSFEPARETSVQTEREVVDTGAIVRDSVTAMKGP